MALPPRAKARQPRPVHLLAGYASATVLLFFQLCVVEQRSRPRRFAQRKKGGARGGGAPRACG